MRRSRTLSRPARNEGVSKFKDQMKASGNTLGSKAVVKPGTDGNYVWMALAMQKDAKDFNTVVGCVKP